MNKILLTTEKSRGHPKVWKRMESNLKRLTRNGMDGGGNVGMYEKQIIIGSCYARGKVPRDRLQRTKAGGRSGGGGVAEHLGFLSFYTHYKPSKTSSASHYL